MSEIKKKYIYGYKEDFPEESDGQILYATDEKELYIDMDSTRERLNKSPDWAEKDSSKSTFIQNKPVLGTASSRDIAESVDETENIPTSKMVFDAVCWYEVKVDPWEEIIANKNYATDYQIGKLQDLDFGEYGIHPMQLYAIDMDDKADNSGKARMSWISKDIICLKPIDESGQNTSNWSECSLREWLRGTFWNCIPELVRSSIVEVNKSYFIYDNDSRQYVTNFANDTIWIPSTAEMYGNNNIKEDTEVRYINSSEDDIKNEFVIKNFSGDIPYQVGYNGPFAYWLRSRYQVGNNYFTAEETRLKSRESTMELGVVVGFCI